MGAALVFQAAAGPPVTWVSQDRRTGVALWARTADAEAFFEVSSEAPDATVFQAGMHASLDLDGAFAEGWAGQVSDLRGTGLAAGGTASGRAQIDAPGHFAAGGGYNVIDVTMDVSTASSFVLIGVAALVGESATVRVLFEGHGVRPTVRRVSDGRAGEFSIEGSLPPGRYRVLIDARATAVAPAERAPDVTIAGFHVVLEVTPDADPCPCDWNADARVDSADFFLFLGDFFAGDADFDGDGVTDSGDLFLFLECMTAGCA